MIHLVALGQYVQTHILAILLCILLSYIIGSLWHGPIFGKQWMAVNNIPMPKKEDMKFSMMLPGLSANFVLVFVQATVMGRTFELVSMESLSSALTIAVILWLSFTALVIVNIYAWVGRPAKAMVLDCGHALVSSLATATVLYYMM